jgi:hypothetical protein
MDQPVRRDENVNPARNQGYQADSMKSVHHYDDPSIVLKLYDLNISWSTSRLRFPSGGRGPLAARAPQRGSGPGPRPYAAGRRGAGARGRPRTGIRGLESLVQRHRDSEATVPVAGLHRRMIWIASGHQRIFPVYYEYILSIHHV